MPFSLAAARSLSAWRWGMTPPVPRLLRGYLQRITEWGDMPVISATAFSPLNFLMMEVAGSQCINQQYDIRTHRSSFNVRYSYRTFSTDCAKFEQ